MTIDLRIALAIMFNLVLVLACGYALLRGGRPERIGAGVNIVGCLLTAAIRLWTPAAWAPMHVIVFAIDTAVAGAFFWLAIRTSRFWPIWAFGFALADILMSISGSLLPRVPLFAYHTGLGIYAYLALGALALGTWRIPRSSTPEQKRGVRQPWQGSENPPTKQHTDAKHS